MGRRKSKEIIQFIKINLEEKKEQIEKIKSLVKESEKNYKQDTSNILENFAIKKANTLVIVDKEIDDQSENFKKRMDSKKLLRINSQPTFKSLKVKFIVN